MLHKPFVYLAFCAFWFVIVLQLSATADQNKDLAEGWNKYIEKTVPTSLHDQAKDYIVKRYKEQEKEYHDPNNPIKGLIKERLEVEQRHKEISTLIKEKVDIESNVLKEKEHLENRYVELVFLIDSLIITAHTKVESDIRIYLSNLSDDKCKV